MAHGKPTFYFSIFNKQSACEFTSAVETEASISFETFVKHGLGLVWQSANNTRNNHSSSSLSINNPKFQIIAFVLFQRVSFLSVLFFTRFPTMLTPLTITDPFTIINYQAREYSRDATTGQWTLDGGRCLFSFLEDTSYFLCIFDGWHQTNWD